MERLHYTIMTEIVELVSIVAAITGSIFGIFRYEINRLCKEIEKQGIELKEIHEAVFHKDDTS